MREIKTYDEFRTIVNSQKQALVYFTASWCGPCESFSPVMNKVANAFETMLTTVKIDIDKVSEASVDFNVRSVPTLLMLENGAPIEGIVGAQSYEKVSRWLMDKLLVF